MAEVSEGIIAVSTAPVTVLRDEITPGRPRVTLHGLATVGCNVILSAMFFTSIVRLGSAHITNAADIIWAVGAALMGLFVLVRSAPKTELVNLATLSTTAGMMLLPGLLRAETNPGQWLDHVGEAVEITGVLLTQLSRIYLGRSFGLLPANRGIVSGGPFRLVRHPVYLGWLILTIGFTMVNLSVHNVLVTLVVLPFMFARIAQEETLLEADPEYRAYREHTRYRLLPGLL